MLFNCNSVNRVLWLALSILLLLAMFGTANAQRGKVPDKEVQVAFANAGIVPATYSQPIVAPQPPKAISMKEMEVAPSALELFSMREKVVLIQCHGIPSRIWGCKVAKFKNYIPEPRDEILKKHLFTGKEYNQGFAQNN